MNYYVKSSPPSSVDSIYTQLDSMPDILAIGKLSQYDQNRKYEEIETCKTQNLNYSDSHSVSCGTDKDRTISGEQSNFPHSLSLSATVPPNNDRIAGERIASTGFAGIILSNGYITGFADSRSTCETNGVAGADTERPQISKVFANEYFVSVFIGTAAIYINEDFEMKRFYIEDWLNQHISHFQTPGEMCKALHLFVRKNIEVTPIKNMEMLAGSVNCDGELTVSDAKINYNDWSMHEEIYEQNSLVCAGSNIYKAYIEANPDAFLTADIYDLRTALENVQDNINYGTRYCPVSGPWEFKQIHS